MNVNIARSLRTVKSVITANSPVLLVGATITGVVATGVLAAKAGYKARGIVVEEEEKRAFQELSEPLTTQEIAKLTWLCYASPVLTGASTIASCMGLHMIHTKRHAALAGLYAITSGKLDDYKEEAEKLLGTKKGQQLNDVMAQKAVDKNDLSINNELTLVEGGSELCFDEWSGRWFMSNMAQINQALNETNALFIDEGELDLNTFYDRLGLSPIPMGTHFGWAKPKVNRLNLMYGSVTSKDGRPAIAITFRDEPKPELGR